jgi:hypothetical protein
MRAECGVRGVACEVCHARCGVRGVVCEGLRVSVAHGCVWRVRGHGEMSCSAIISVSLCTWPHVLPSDKGNGGEHVVAGGTMADLGSDKTVKWTKQHHRMGRRHQPLNRHKQPTTNNQQHQPLGLSPRTYHHRTIELKGSPGRDQNNKKDPRPQRQIQQQETSPHKDKYKGKLLTKSKAKHNKKQVKAKNEMA